MRAALAGAAFFICGNLIAAPALPRNFRIPPTPLEAKAGDLHAFYGQVKAVDASSRTITLGMPMPFTFKVSGETQITVRRGGSVGFDAIQPGAGANIEARRTANGWTALKIKLERGATFRDEMSARTPQGKTITGPMVADFIVYEPPAEVINRNIDYGNRSGFYQVAVRPDGTVASVRTIKSMGVAGLDAHAHTRLRQVRFRPGSVTEVRLPLSVYSIRR